MKIRQLLVSESIKCGELGISVADEYSTGWEWLNVAEVEQLRDYLNKVLEEHKSKEK